MFLLMYECLRAAVTLHWSALQVFEDKMRHEVGSTCLASPAQLLGCTYVQ